MATNNIFLLVKDQPAKDLLDCQTISIPPEVFTLLNASFGDFLRLNLPDGSCLIARAGVICNRLLPKPNNRNAKRTVYHATCTTSVTANCSSRRSIPSGPFMLELSKVTVLEKLPIESLTCKVWFKTISAFLMYKKNKLLVIKTLQSILSMNGIISNCCIDLSANPNADIFGIARVQIGNVKTCCLEDNNLTDQRIDTQCQYVGHRFVCPDVDCKLNAKYTESSRVFTPCEICSNLDDLRNDEANARIEDKSCIRETSASPAKLNNSAAVVPSSDLTVRVKDECNSEVLVPNIDTPHVLPHSYDSSNKNISKSEHQEHNAPDKTHGALDGTHDARDKTHGAPNITHGAPDRTHGAPDITHGAPDITHGAPDRTHGAPNITHGAPDRTHYVSDRTRDFSDRTLNVPDKAHDTPDRTHDTADRTHDTPDQTHYASSLLKNNPNIIHDTPHKTHSAPNRTRDTSPSLRTPSSAHEHVRYGGLTVCEAETLQQLRLRQEQLTVPVGGVDEAKEELRRLLREVALREVPGSTHRMVSGCGALLVGPAGCGKATLVRHLSAATATMLVTVCCRSLAASGSRGAAAEGFSEAQLLSQERPCILFLPHIDQLAALPPHTLKKDRWGLAQVRHSLNCCLDAGCLIVASTSDVVRVPECLRNMFNTELGVGSSTLPYRVDVLRVLASSRRWPGLDHCALAKLTPGYLGADLKQLMERVEERLDQQQKLPSNMTSEELTALTVAEVAHFTPYLVKSNPLLGERPEGVPLGGMDHLMAELQQILGQMIDSGSLFARLGLNVPRGVLLYGPPGCGKTQLVCALAASRGCTFFLVQPKHIVSPYVGETEQNLQAAFQAARTCRPSVVFFDEIDGLFGDRCGDQVSVVRQNLILEMLQILDGAGAEDSHHSSMDGVLVCGATNNPDKLDAALLRPGRFDRLVYVPPPDADQRLQILKVKCSGAELESEQVLEEIAAMTDLLTGGDLTAIIEQAMAEAMLSGSVTGDGRVRLTAVLLRKYAARTRPTVTQDMLRRYQTFRKR